MKILLIVIYIIFLLFLQIGVLPHLAIFNSYPNLILLSILSLSIVRGWKKILGWTIISGLFLDFYSLSNFLGISAVALLAVSYIVYSLSQNTFKKTTPLSLALIFLITIFIYNLLVIAFYEIANISPGPRFPTFIFTIIYNWIVALPIFYLIKRYAQSRKI